jgi:hypothetical protein
VTRGSATGPPPGLFNGPGAEDAVKGWAIPALAAVAAIATCGVWLAGEVTYLTGSSYQPGNPLRYIRSLIAGRAPWPDVWGWAALAFTVALAAASVAVAFHVVTAKIARKHRADRIARLLAPRADRQRLTPQARARESARLSTDSPTWTGSPIGRVIPGRLLARSSPEDVSIDVWGTSRTMTQEQATQVLRAASGQGTMYTKVVRISRTKYGATHAATEQGKLACGSKPKENRPATEVNSDLAATTCRFCRAEIGLDENADAGGRLEALFVLAFTLGMRPGELRTLTWDLVDLDRGIVHVWRSARRDGDTKTRKSRRSLQLPKRAVTALQTHKARQAKERLAAGDLWQDNNLVFCHEDGRRYSSDALNWRFSRMTQRAGVGHWHSHEGRHTAVSIMSSNGVPIQEISDTVGHKSTHVTETVYRHVIVPAIRGGATVMDSVFGDPREPEDGAASA